MQNETMYRHRTIQPDSKDQFVTRLYDDLPVVQSTVNKLGQLYNGTKQHNRLFRFTLETAASGFGLVVSTWKPIVEKFEKPMESLNVLACDRLEKFERDYPIITKPTDVVVKRATEICTTVMKPVTERVKPVTDTVGSVAHYGITKINDAKDYTYNTTNEVKSYGIKKATDIKSYGMNKLSDVTSVGAKQVSRLFDNPASQVVLSRVDVAFGVVDSYVEKYLPEEEPVEQKSPIKKKKVDGIETEKQIVVYNKAIQMTCKVYGRVYNRIVRYFELIKTRATEMIDKLRFKTDKEIAAYPLTTTLTNARITVTNLLTSITRDALAAVTNLADFVASTLTSSLQKKYLGSSSEETSNDTSKTEKYEDHNGGKHDRQLDQQQQQ